MKKTIIISSVIVILAAIIGGGWYYKYNYVDTVTDYIRITYSLPTRELFPQESLFGGEEYKMTEAKIQTAFVHYNSDEAAYKSEYKGAQNSYNFVSKKMNGLKPESGNLKDEMIYKAKAEACYELMQENVTLIRFTHIRKIDIKEFKKNVAKFFFEQEKFEAYAKKNKIEVKIIPVWQTPEM